MKKKVIKIYYRQLPHNKQHLTQYNLNSLFLNISKRINKILIIMFSSHIKNMKIRIKKSRNQYNKKLFISLLEMTLSKRVYQIQLNKQLSPRKLLQQNQLQIPLKPTKEILKISNSNNNSNYLLNNTNNNNKFHLFSNNNKFNQTMIITKRIFLKQHLVLLT